MDQPFLHCGVLAMIEDGHNLINSIALSERVTNELEIMFEKGKVYLNDNHLYSNVVNQYTKFIDTRQKRIELWTERKQIIETKWLYFTFMARKYQKTFKPSIFYQEIKQNNKKDILDSNLLQYQIERYQLELTQRVYENNQTRKFQKASKLQQEKINLQRKKRQLHIARKRSENVQQRWEYLSVHLLRRCHLNRLHCIRLHRLESCYDQEFEDIEKTPYFTIAQNFVDTCIHQATLLAVWAIEMQGFDSPPQIILDSQFTTVLHLCMLLCPNPFGAQFGTMYQRYFAKECTDLNVAIEWKIFEVEHLEFPTLALDEWADGYFICGGPAPNLPESPPFWQSQLVEYLQYLIHHERRLGALGRGHCILAMALGGNIHQKVIPQSTWTILEDKILAVQTIKTQIRAIPALHGEYVASLDNPHIKSTINLPKGTFISKFKSKTILSFDGFPECGGFVFIMLSKFLQSHVQESNSPWPSGAQMVASKLIHHFLFYTIDRRSRTNILTQKLALRKMKIFACKSPLEFISDTNEYLNFVSQENVDAVVLQINLSRDNFPVVFPSAQLDKLTDLPTIFPSYLHTIPPKISISDLTLHELKLLSILHAYQHSNHLKSPRGLLNYDSSQTNRLQTLTNVLEHINRLNQKRIQNNGMELKLIFTFTEETIDDYIGFTIDRIALLWKVLTGALAVLDKPIVYLMSRDARFLKIIRKLRPLWHYIFIVPQKSNTEKYASVQEEAVAISHIADAILIPKSYHVLIPPYTHEGLNNLQESIIQVYHRNGVQIFVDFNDSQPTTLSLIKEHLLFRILCVDGVFITNPHTTHDSIRLWEAGHSYVDEVYIYLHESFLLLSALNQHEKLHRKQQVNLNAHHTYKMHSFKEASWIHGLRYVLNMDVLGISYELLNGMNINAEKERQVKANQRTVEKRGIQSAVATARQMTLGVTTPALLLQKVQRCRTRILGKRHHPNPTFNAIVPTSRPSFHVNTIPLPPVTKTSSHARKGFHNRFVMKQKGKGNQLHSQNGMIASPPQTPRDQQNGHFR
ncbi:hypothetical protein THRCLA_20828 [Thraustotheca clavata]|uniref:GP-PDE domain-containing protein n=1 Tax=Thraustotheca clavata TaxID=74557 RepID=A0A1W0A2Z2_9STRA|nr:hypothetical protein THRCLA_20828 [Thraustotheca clavata]